MESFQSRLAKVNRTRHDYFYLQLVTHQYIIFRKLLKEFSDDSFQETLSTLKEELEKAGKTELTQELLDKFNVENVLKEAITKLFNLKTCYHIIIVFTALCLESLINDYCAIKKSTTFLKNHLDKLDTPSKWIIIPKLVINKEISTDSQAFELLKELYSLRNELVHPKSKEFDIGSMPKELAKQYTTQTNRSFQAIREATSELYKIDPSFTYLEDYKWMWDTKEQFQDISEIETFIYNFMGKQNLQS